MTKQPHMIATARIVAIYALFGLCWILWSDNVLGWLVHDSTLMVKIALFKGSFFVMCTAGLLYLLISRFARQLASAENEQIQSLKNYQAIFNATNEAIFIHDADSGKVIDVNDRMLEMFGYGRHEALDADIGRFGEDTPPYSGVEASEKLRKAVVEGPQVFEWHSRKKTGELFWSEVSLRHVPMHNRIIAVVRDTTERKQEAEEKAKLASQLQQAQKMEFVGRLAGGIAHDFNNMLTVISGQAELALLKIKPDDPFATNFMEIKKTAERSADLTRQLLAYARRQTVAPKVLDLNETITALLRMLQRLMGEGIQLVWQPAPGVLPVKMDPSQVDQILANLCVNARDAIEGEGMISIQAAGSTVDAAYCAGHPDAVPGEYVRVTVSDDGHGMDQETIARIFEPFFTTKRMGKGTGLGLATVYGIVKQNSGFITIHSTPGEGSSFSIYIPRYGGLGENDSTGAAHIPVPGGTETILVVEDETAILDIAQIMLGQLGYAVLPARSPEEAIQLARDHQGDIHLLLTDVIMPGMNGLELSRQLLSTHPSLKLLFMSGYTADVIANHCVLEEGVHFMQKPFTLHGIGAKVREVLDD